MRPWTLLLPLFLVRWHAQRHGERIRIGPSVFVEGPPGCFFRVEP